LELPVVKRLSETRWSARCDAIRALYCGYDSIVEVLSILADDVEQKANCRAEVDGLRRRLDELETVIMLMVWHKILMQFKKTSKSLQESGFVINTAILLIKSLKSFIELQRNDFDAFEMEAKEKCGHDRQLQTCEQTHAHQKSSA